MRDESVTVGVGEVVGNDSGIDEFEEKSVTADEIPGLHEDRFDSCII